jgi:hypothetical protein
MGIRLTFFVLFIGNLFCYSQIINCEEMEYSKDYKEKKYSTFHFVKSEFSMRSFQVFVVDDIIFFDLISRIPKIFSEVPKQDYTDFYVLGISNLDLKNLSEIEKEIIHNYLREINKYRKNKNLSVVNENIDSSPNIKYLKSVDELCQYMICDN